MEGPCEVSGFQRLALRFAWDEGRFVSGAVGTVSQSVCM